MSGKFGKRCGFLNLISLLSGLRETLTTCFRRDRTFRMQFQSTTLHQTIYFFIDIKLLFVAIYVKCLRRGPVQNPSFKDKNKLYSITLHYVTLRYITFSL